MQFARSAKTSVSLSLNVPGFPKSNSQVLKFFDICLNELKRYLKAHCIPIYVDEAFTGSDAAGDFFLIPCGISEESISELKQICEEFEEKHPQGRFIDVDVTDLSGNPVSSGKLKCCFFCGQKPAIVCRREKSHDIKELRDFMFRGIDEYCIGFREKDISAKLASLALTAILTEVSLTPKPGLVDKFSNGSHNDMNYQTFLRSSAAISAWFGDLVIEGFHFRDDLTKALPVIRSIGLHMERAMFAATKNINTQKGLVFLMSVTLFACGYLYAGQDNFEVNRFRDIIMKICKDLSAELDVAVPKTHGETVYRKYRVTGIRGEAETGFPAVFDYGLPALESFKTSDDEAMIKAFLSIASHNNDTNILFRSSMEVLDVFKAMASAAFKQYNRDNYNVLIAYCKKENISPGGSADLLAVSIFIHAMIHSC